MHRLFRGAPFGLPAAQSGEMLSVAREGWHDALAVLFPVDCAGCGAPDRALCAECRMVLRSASARAHESHVLETRVYETHVLETRLLADSTQVVSAVRYEAQVRRMILALKEQGRTDVVKALAQPLRTAIEWAATWAEAAGDEGRDEVPDAAGEAADPNVDVELCPVPSSKHAKRRRGYRPVEALASAAGFRLARVLTHSVQTQEQKSLDLEHRGINLHGAFIASPAVRGRRFVIVDDVVTSGATLIEAARALREGGAHVIGAATLAFTPRRNVRNETISARARDIHRVDSYGG